MGRRHHCLCHKTGYESVTDLTSADRKTGSAFFYFLYAVHAAVCVHIHNRLCVRHRYLLFPEEKLSKRGGTWLCQMGRCSFHLQALPRQAVHPESYFNPELPHGAGLLSAQTEFKCPCGGRLRSGEKPYLCSSQHHAVQLFHGGHRSQGRCETFQSEKDWHISTESLFIVMKLVRVGELNA